MTRMPGAIWRGPIPNQGGQMSGIEGLVLHVMEGTLAGTDSWFKNPASKVSAHFGNGKDGTLYQWVEVGTVAWAEVDGNPTWISVENEGNSGDSLTASQLENCAQLLAWLRRTHGIPLQISDDPANVPGLTGHGLGGAAWGGHTDCPGAPILGLRQQIITRAEQILGTASTTPSTPASGGTTVGTIPSSIATKWPEIAGEFPANTSFDSDTALIWSDAGSRAAALHSAEARDAANSANQAAGQARDAANALSTKLDALSARVGAPPAVDVNALAAAITPHLTAGATAEQLAQAVAVELSKRLGQ